MNKSMNSTGLSNSMSEGAIPIDWSEGWDGSPVLSATPRFTQGRDAMAKATSPLTRAPVGTSKKLLYRRTFLDDQVYKTEIVPRWHTGGLADGTSGKERHYLPGPGHHRTSRQLPLWDTGDKHVGNMNTGRTQDTYSCSWAHTTHTNLRSSQVGQTHLNEGEDIDASRTSWVKVPNYSVTKSINMRSLSSLKNFNENTKIWHDPSAKGQEVAKVSRLPTSFLTPGPGAYTQLTSFGQSSGPTRKRYMATNRHDNCGQAKKADSFMHTEKRETFTGFRRSR